MSFYVATDDETRAIVWFLTGKTIEDRDYQAYVDHIGRIDAAWAGRDGAAVLIVDSGVPPPSSAWRRRIADASARLESRPVFALVTSSPLIRGVVTAINWIRPPSYPHAVVATPEEAFAWAEQQLGRPLPLARLLSEVATAAGSRPS